MAESCPHNPSSGEPCNLPEGHALPHRGFVDAWVVESDGPQQGLIIQADNGLDGEPGPWCNFILRQGGHFRQCYRQPGHAAEHRAPYSANEEIIWIDQTGDCDGPYGFETVGLVSGNTGLPDEPVLAGFTTGAGAGGVGGGAGGDTKIAPGKGNGGPDGHIILEDANGQEILAFGTGGEMFIKGKPVGNIDRLAVILSIEDEFIKEWQAMVGLRPDEPISPTKSKEAK